MAGTVKAYSTIGTFLKIGAASNSITKVCPIKSYPQLGGDPEQIETTDMEDDSQTFVPGVKQQDTMAFTANYTKENYAALKALEDQENVYELDFGDESGKDGQFSWKGQHVVYLNEGEVNGVREMTISVTASTSIENEAAATAFPAE